VKKSTGLNRQRGEDQRRKPLPPIGERCEGTARGKNGKETVAGKHVEERKRKVSKVGNPSLKKKNAPEKNVPIQRKRERKRKGIKTLRRQNRKGFIHLL